MYSLLEQLCRIHAPSGEERPVRDFILDYVQSNQKKWAVQPEIIYGDDFQDCLILAFGKPRTAVFAHMDSVGFTVRYQDQLVPIGGPRARTGFQLVGRDSLGEIECSLRADEEGNIFYEFPRGIDTGTSLTFACNFRETEESVTSCYLDNRLGVFASLKLAETLENGLIVFSCWEEHGGGSVSFLASYMVERWNIRQALIADITWVTEGVRPGNGVVVSMRDRNVPRRSFIERIVSLAAASGVMFQLEVEGGGSSDGRELQQSPYAIDWCFIGAPEDNVHSPDEKVNKKDVDSMISLYRFLTDRL